MNIIYSGKITDLKGGYLSIDVLKQTFVEAKKIHQKLQLNNKKIAYFFIDPLLNSFEAANKFYFGVFESEVIEKINTYKSGSSPIQALSDAKELIDCGLYDAVFIFGYEPLLTNKQVYGKEAVVKAMSIFEDRTIIQCYNEIAHLLCKQLEIEEKEFVSFSHQLFMNYSKTFTRLTGTTILKGRGRSLDDLNADLFKLTDCANPNIDFAGGLILANDQTVDLLQISNKDKIKVSGVKYVSVEGSPEKLAKIVGKKGTIFPHLKKAFREAQTQANINVVDELKKRNLFLEAYTCYPPVPIAFLLATGMMTNVRDLPVFLEHYEITVTGGMNLARAPWNNPALNGLIVMYDKLKEGSTNYGIVHGNGGIGEIQGIALLEKISKD